MPAVHPRPRLSEPQQVLAYLLPATACRPARGPRSGAVDLRWGNRSDSLHHINHSLLGRVIVSRTRETRGCPSWPNRRSSPPPEPCERKWSPGQRARHGAVLHHRHTGDAPAPAPQPVINIRFPVPSQDDMLPRNIGSGGSVSVRRSSTTPKTTQAAGPRDRSLPDHPARAQAPDTNGRAHGFRRRARTTRSARRRRPVKKRPFPYIRRIRRLAVAAGFIPGGVRGCQCSGVPVLGR